jgi:hypothetical protein
MTRRRFPNARSRTLDFHRAVERSRYSGHRALDQCVEVILLPVLYAPLRLITAPSGGGSVKQILFCSHHPPFFVVRVREGVPGSPRALVSARPHPQAAAQDRRDTVAQRRARDCAGTRQVPVHGCKLRHGLAPSAIILRRNHEIFTIKPILRH